MNYDFMKTYPFNGIIWLVYMLTAYPVLVALYVASYAVYASIALAKALAKGLWISMHNKSIWDWTAKPTDFFWEIKL